MPISAHGKAQPQANGPHNHKQQRRTHQRAVVGRVGRDGRNFRAAGQQRQIGARPTIQSG
ncbi:MAG TPA: hypothetical protein VKE41_14415 [Roseiflexaceae bacterium]|nr:hypothetical protein [Roseiflexaceae bacterium]